MKKETLQNILVNIRRIEDLMKAEPEKEPMAIWNAAQSLRQVTEASLKDLLYQEYLTSQPRQGQRAEY